MNKLYFAVFMLTVSCGAQEITPEHTIVAINEAFDAHQLVLLGDIHGSVQEHRILIDLVHSKKFSGGK